MRVRYPTKETELPTFDSLSDNQKKTCLYALESLYNKDIDTALNSLLENNIDLTEFYGYITTKPFKDDLDIKMFLLMTEYMLRQDDLELNSCDLVPII